MFFKPQTQEQILQKALKIAEKRMSYGVALTKPEAAEDFLKVWAATLNEEVFGCIWLTSAHTVIKVEDLFFGSIDSATVYPRVVVRAGLTSNAAAVIFFHNHPSGNPEPSAADVTLTKRLREALSLVDIRVLDHMVVGKTVVSMAAEGRI